MTVTPIVTAYALANFPPSFKIDRYAANVGFSRISVIPFSANSTSVAKDATSVSTIGSKQNKANSVVNTHATTLKILYSNVFSQAMPPIRKLRYQDPVFW